MEVIVDIAGVTLLLLLGMQGVSRILGKIGQRAILSLKGRWIIVTGCDTGIGALAVSRLVEQGAKVIAFTFSEAGKEAALSAGAVMSPCLDLTDEGALVQACEEVHEKTKGALWGIVHNAGAVQPGFIEFQPLAVYRRIMDVNFFATVNLMRQFIPGIRKSAGRVVIITSVDGIVSLPGNAPYDAAKFAAEAYADALRVELSLWKVQVSVINPSTMKTPLAKNFFDSMRQSWDAMDKEDPQGSWKNHWTREWLEEYISFNGDQLAKIAQEPGCVVDHIVHALAAKRPRMRYLSGTLANTLFFLLWKAPEHWAYRFKTLLVNPKPRL